MSDDPDDLDLLAAEYVLGVLDADAARAVEAMARSNAAVDDAILAWQVRLAPLAQAVAPVKPPPSLWDRIDQQTRPTTASVREGPVAMPSAPRPSALARTWRNAGLWRATTAASLALAAGLAAFIVLRGPLAPPTRYVAALAPIDAKGPAFLAHTEADGSIVVATLNHVDVAPGKDLELWALPQGAQTPIPLGVLPASGRRLALSDLPRAETRLLVSLEPAGGSPTGLPTGPVLYAGMLAALE